jgi:hypothetical protein
MKGKNTLKISRGYRLRVKTHNLIKNLQEITSLSSDQVLSRSCMLFYKTILEQNGISKTENSNLYNKP